MNELEAFIKNIKLLKTNSDNSLDLSEQRKAIKEINEFLFCYYDDIGTVNVLGDDRTFISDFHKYWMNNHERILGLSIDETKCEKAAEILHEVYIRTNGKAFTEIYDTLGLNKDEICRIRLLTANQDFRGSRSFSELVDIYNNNKKKFDEEYIYEHPNDFVKVIGVTGLSQGDKRINYAKKIAQFLIENNSTPIDIIKCFNNNVYEFRNSLIDYDGAGYGNKKADMFIRDMVVNNVWSNVIDYEKIDVASDYNTIKVALRTGILKSEIPLVSSLIDIFDYQYSFVDRMTAKAWRTVWEKWNLKYNDVRLCSPSLLDYFLYNTIGRQFCKEIAYTCKCENGHVYNWYQTKSRKCKQCEKEGRKGTVEVIEKKLPCMSENPKISISDLDFVKNNISNPAYDNCPFALLCDLTNNKSVGTPKSISILGKTGWTTAYSKKGDGGGGLMA